MHGCDLNISGSKLPNAPGSRLCPNPSGLCVKDLKNGGLSDITVREALCGLRGCSSQIGGFGPQIGLASVDALSNSMK
jgi:hypothetical protein